MRQFLAGLGGSSGAFAAAGVVAALVAAGYWVQSGRNAADVPTAVVAVLPKVEEVEEAPVAEPEVAEAPAPEVPEAVEEAAVAPTFDEVRREADGVTVIAGVGSPGSRITVLKNGEAVASATADAAGKFATIALIPPDGQGHILTLLQAADGKELASRDEIILAPMAAPVVVAEVEVEAAEPQIAEDAAEIAEPEAAEDAAEVAEAPAHVEDVVAVQEDDVAPVQEQATPVGQVAEVEAAEEEAPTAPVVTEIAEAEPSPVASPEVAEAKPAEIAPVVKQAAEEAGPTPVATPRAEPVETAPVVAEAAEEAGPTPVATPQAEPAETAPVVEQAAEEAVPTPVATPQAEPVETAEVAETAPVEEAPIELAALPQEAPAPEVPVAEAPVAQAEVVTTPEQPTTEVAVLKSTEEGVELLNTRAPEVLDNVAIDTISYSDVGEVQLAGRAQTEASAVRVYLDNDAVLDFPVGDDGRWRGELPDIDEGIYTLRVDEVAADGQVTSRVETPFKREAPDVLAQAAAGLDGPLKAITVQKGATLWAIARERYGEGELYVRVFEANREAIRDPDLIYPGQIFDLPD